MNANHLIDVLYTVYVLRFIFQLLTNNQKRDIVKCLAIVFQIFISAYSDHMRWIFSDFVANILISFQKHEAKIIKLKKWSLQEIFSLKPWVIFNTFYLNRIKVNSLLGSIFFIIFLACNKNINVVFYKKYEISWILLFSY